MRFFLGSHRPHWLGLTDVDLFISHRTLNGRKKLPRAQGRWALDSGGFTELSMFGEWRTGIDEYVEAVERYAIEVGGLEWAAPQDWMCEPWIVAKTGLSVREHQERTVANFLDLKDRGPFIPVLQGWTPNDYLAHVAMYDDAHIDLRDYDTVGLGSVCRRGSTRPVEDLLIDLHNFGISLHGFGFKRNGLQRVAYLLKSSDSLAWSFTARRAAPLPGCSHKSCTNCLRYALQWRERVLRSMNEQQPSLFCLVSEENQ